jgi:transposase InsO family protein
VFKVERDIEKLKRWMISKREKGWPVTTICTHARISRDMFYRWWNRYQAEGNAGLSPRLKRPHTIHYKVTPHLAQRIITLRNKYRWGPDKIAGYLRLKGTPLSHTTVYEVICAAGLNNPLDQPRKTWGKKRFERLHSNSLWQADFKLVEDDFWMLTFLDDHSRFIVGSNDGIWDPTTEAVIALLERCLNRFGAPEQILTDRGVQFYCSDKEGKEQGVSAFTRFCTDNSIQHIVASKRRPTTIGKVEAFHKAYELEARMFSTLSKFVNYWNWKRPHQGLGYLYPAEVYFRDMRM